jgi:hypothetical protein
MKCENLFTATENTCQTYQHKTDLLTQDSCQTQVPVVPTIRSIITSFAFLVPGSPLLELHFSFSPNRNGEDMSQDWREWVLILGIG